MSENTEQEVSSRARPYRISEEEYAKGHYLPRQDLHRILETLYKLKLQSQDEENKTGFLIARRQRHPETFLLTDSESARKDLHALIPLADLLGQIQEMPKDMIDLDNFEYRMALKGQQIRPAIKKAILEGITYTDKDGQKKPLAQFFMQKLKYSGKNVYGVCVPQTAQGQKALLKLAGFNIHACDISEIIYSEREKAIFNGLKTGSSSRDLAEHYNVCQERIRQIYAKIYRRMVRVDVFKQSGLPQDKSVVKGRSSEGKDAQKVYTKVFDGDFVITQAAAKRGLIRGYGLPSRCITTTRTKKQIIRFDCSCRTR